MNPKSQDQHQRSIFENLLVWPLACSPARRRGPRPTLCSFAKLIGLFFFIPESSDAEDVKLINGRRNRDKALLGIFLSSPQPGRRLLCILCALRVPPFLILYFSELWEAWWMSQRTTGQVAWLFPPRTRGLWLCVIFLFGQTICLCPAMPYGLDRQSALAAGINKRLVQLFRHWHISTKHPRFIHVSSLRPFLMLLFTRWGVSLLLDKTTPPCSVTAYLLHAGRREGCRS